jgi:hypothetical protein
MGFIAGLSVATIFWWILFLSFGVFKANKEEKGE